MKTLPLLLLVLVLAASVVAVKIDTPQYRIETTKETSGWNSDGFTHTIEAEWKGAAPLTRDFCMRTPLPLTRAAFEVLTDKTATTTTSENVANVTGFTPITSGCARTYYYNVTTSNANGTTTRPYCFDSYANLGGGTYRLTYTDTREWAEWTDRTGAVDHATTPLGELYCVAATWEPGETKTARLRYRDLNYSTFKWDAAIGTLATQSIDIYLDPFTNASLYEADFLTDVGSHNIATINSTELSAKNNYWKANSTKVWVKDVFAAGESRNYIISTAADDSYLDPQNVFARFDDFEVGTGNWTLAGSSGRSTTTAHTGTYSLNSSSATSAYSALSLASLPTGVTNFCVGGWIYYASAMETVHAIDTDMSWANGEIISDSNYPSAGYWGRYISSWTNTGVASRTGQWHYFEVCRLGTNEVQRMYDPLTLVYNLTGPATPTRFYFSQQGTAKQAYIDDVFVRNYTSSPPVVSCVANVCNVTATSAMDGYQFELTTTIGTNLSITTEGRRYTSKNITASLNVTGFTPTWGGTATNINISFDAGAHYIPATNNTFAAWTETTKDTLQYVVVLGANETFTDFTMTVTSNAIPVLSGDTYAPANATNEDTLAANVTYTDAEADEGNVTAIWYTGTTIIGNSTVAATNGTVAGFELTPSAFTGNIVVTLNLTPTSGSQSGATTQYNWTIYQSVNITNCVTLTRPDDYTLTDDLSTSGSYCLIIAADNVTVEGDGHSVTAAAGVIYLNSNTANTVLRNLVILGGQQGVENNLVTANINGLILDNNVFTNQGDRAVRLGRADGVIIANNTITGIRGIQIVGVNIAIYDNDIAASYTATCLMISDASALEDLLHNVTIYNNRFTDGGTGSCVHYGDTDGNSTIWFNTTRQNGTPIYGGLAEIGGNYWANAVGTGYSEVCTDADYDAFCDSAYEPVNGFYDYLPLTEYVPEVAAMTCAYNAAPWTSEETPFICTITGAENFTFNCHGATRNPADGSLLDIMPRQGEIDEYGVTGGYEPTPANASIQTVRVLFSTKRLKADTPTTYEARCTDQNGTTITYAANITPSFSQFALPVEAAAASAKNIDYVVFAAVFLLVIVGIVAWVYHAGVRR